MQWTRPVSRQPEVARPDGRAAAEAASAVPEPAPLHPVFVLQRRLGNRAVARWIQRDQEEKEGEAPRPIEAFQGTGAVVPGLAFVYAEASALAEIQGRLVQGDSAKVTGKSGAFWVIDRDGKRGFVLEGDLQVSKGSVTGASGANVPALQAASGTPGEDWLTIVPDAVPREGAQAAVERPGPVTAQGRLVTYSGRQTTYTQSGGKEIATAGPLDTAAGVTPQNVTPVLAAIRDARAKIQARAFEKAALTRKEKVPGPGGTTVERTVDTHEGIKSTAETGEPGKADARYKEWLKTARPTGAEDRPWKVFQQIMEWEGGPADVMTYDAANVTWGAGFAGLGAREKFKAGPEMLNTLFESSPDVRAIFWRAGFSFLDRKLVVVDVDRGWKLRGLDAELYVRSNETLLSLMINVAQGEFLSDGQTPTEQGQPKPDDAKRQAVLDAQYQTFLKFTYRDTDTGDPDVVALKAHARHAGSDKWRLASTFTNRQALIDYLYREDPVNAKAVVPSKWPPTTAPK